MRLFVYFIPFVPLLLISTSCTNNVEVKDNDAKATATLVGVWRGDGTYKDEENIGWKESWKIVRQADGKYAIDYLMVHDVEKLYETSFDEGTWSYKDGVYYEVNSQGSKVTYVVYSVKKDWFEYNIAERKGSANIQESKTVDKFKLQDPPKGYSEVSYEQPVDNASDEPIAVSNKDKK